MPHACKPWFGALLVLLAAMSMPASAVATQPERIVAIGDLHGDHEAWRALAGAARLIDTKGRWTGGKIYDPGEGKTYDARIRINPDGTLKLEGCVLIVCQAQTWRRPT